tara:strand:+ start:16721 stop:17902 length:1182 start_codon:yes stop_codon:yes gene_type:complete
MNNFNNLKVAFNDKSNHDLRRAYLLFKIISIPLISKFSIKLLKLCLKLKLPVKLLIKSTVFKHFCGGTTINNCSDTIDLLWKSNVGTILDYSAEGKKTNNDFDNVMHEIIKTIIKSKNHESIPFTVFKFTGIVKFSLLEKISEKKILSKNEQNEKEKFLDRVEKICRTAKENQVRILIDAEESWIQEAIDKIVLMMMKKFNTDECWIYNTIQMYRKDRIKYLKNLIGDTSKEKYFIGLKIVRGAYHSQEIIKSEENNYSSPVHRYKTKTDEDFNKAIKICVENLNIISICLGTHNEKSTLLLTSLMKKHNIQNNDNRIFFSQLLGMSDHISYNLSKNGYNVAKYVPYGPVKEVIPYLIRRAEENTSITGQMGRELTNIVKERDRRKKDNITCG